ncbi:hypothetical protein GALL_179100 [mine drainage metagenome]|uniref:DUF1318 domain-containing protein n=1 Tax=mine drainage metagenome TaxID=410659 RepID=A0A1J5RV02_9ZZZZ
MKKLLLGLLVLVASMFAASWVVAAADLEVNTPAISSIQAKMQSRHAQLSPYYASGAIGLTKDAFIAVKDANAVPLAQRGALTSLVKDENADRANLYKEIAAANGHPEWQADIQATFASRWIDKAQSGWWVQRAGGWVKK